MYVSYILYKHIELIKTNSLPTRPSPRFLCALSCRRQSPDQDGNQNLRQHPPWIAMTSKLIASPSWDLCSKFEVCSFVILPGSYSSQRKGDKNAFWHPIQQVPTGCPANNAHAVTGPLLTDPATKTTGKKYMTSLSAAGSIDMDIFPFPWKHGLDEDDNQEGKHETRWN